MIILRSEGKRRLCPPRPCRCSSSRQPCCWLRSCAVRRSRRMTRVVAVAQRPSWVVVPRGPCPGAILADHSCCACRPLPVPASGGLASWPTPLLGSAPPVHGAVFGQRRRAALLLASLGRQSHAVLAATPSPLPSAWPAARTPLLPPWQVAPCSMLLLHGRLYAVRRPRQPVLLLARSGQTVLVEHVTLVVLAVGPCTPAVT